MLTGIDEANVSVTIQVLFESIGRLYVETQVLRQQLQELAALKAVEVEGKTSA